MERTDEELVEAYIHGDAKAFNAIVERHRRRLTMVARRYTRNETDAHDIVQDAFLKASCTVSGFRHEAKLGTWLHRLVMNAGYDFLNHRANRENASLDSGAVDPDRNWALSYDTTYAIDQHIVMKTAFSLLRDDQREALYLTDIAGYGVREAAEYQGVKPGTIKSRRARAKQVLRAALEASADDAPAAPQPAAAQ